MKAYILCRADPLWAGDVKDRLGGCYAKAYVEGHPQDSVTSLHTTCEKETDLYDNHRVKKLMQAVVVASGNQLRLSCTKPITVGQCLNLGTLHPPG
jgi:hypothetical protein